MLLKIQIQLKNYLKEIVAEGGDFGYDDPSLDVDNDDYGDDESRPLLNKTGSFSTSTPAYQTRVREELEMKTTRQKHFGGPSYAETTHMDNEGSGAGVLGHPSARKTRRRVLNPGPRTPHCPCVSDSIYTNYDCNKNPN